MTMQMFMQARKILYAKHSRAFSKLNPRVIRLTMKRRRIFETMNDVVMQ